jgi:predicted dienelactone hydrolase
LTTEIWYPAHADTLPGTVYHTLLRDGVTPTMLHGSASRNAPPAQGFAPLIVISHGYPGNRFLLSHLAESLAANGFVVAAADHAGSTYEDQQAFDVTLVNRPLDQRGVINGMAMLGGDLGNLVDCENVGLIGYSMGGYGALVLRQPLWITRAQGTAAHWRVIWRGRTATRVCVTIGSRRSCRLALGATRKACGMRRVSSR